MTAPANKSVSVFINDEMRERFLQLTPEGRGHARAILLAGIKEAESMYSDRQAKGRRLRMRLVWSKPE